MRKIITLFVLLASTTAFSQKTSNLVVFTEDASLFYLVVNGVTQNYEPKSNIKLTGLTNENNQLLIKFAEPHKGTIKKAIYFPEMGVETTAKITYTKKGYKLRMFGEVAIDAAPQGAAGQYTTAYTTTNAVPVTNGTVVPANNGTTINTNNSSTTTNSNTTTTNGGTVNTTTTTTTNTTTSNTTSNTTVNNTTVNTTNTNAASTGSLSVNLNYNWTPGGLYRFSVKQTDDVSTSMMGMNMKEKFYTTTEFALHLLTVQSNGTANGVLYLIDYNVTDSKGAVLATINDIPADAVRSEVSVDKKGKFTFAKELMLITTPTGNVLAYAKPEGNGVALGGQAGDMQVDAYAEFDPRTGQLKANYKVTDLKNTRKITVKVTEETDQLDVLPYDYMEFLALPEGSVTQGEKSSMRSGIYTVDCIAQKIENGIAEINYVVNTDKSKDMVTGDAKVTNSNGMDMMNMSTGQVADPNSMMTTEDKNAMGMMKDMSPQITCNMTSNFSYATGMFNQVNGVLTTSMNAMGMQFTVVSNMTMKKL